MATNDFLIPDKKEWTSYVKHLNYYLIANEVTEDAKSVN